MTQDLIDMAERMAKALYNRYERLVGSKSKECTLIAVDELIKEQDMHQNGEVNPVKFWQEVKKQVQKLQ